MTSKPIYFCVYRITNLVEKKHYYGYKSSSIHPSKVIGITYFSSSRDKEFISDQKENPQNYKYKIVQIFGSKEEAIAREIKLHSKFDVGVNIKFYNRSKQTSVGFDTTGITPSEFNKQRSSDIHKGIPKTIESNIKRSKSLTSRKLSEQSKINLSKARTGKHYKKLSEVQRKYLYITPLGTFDYARALESVNISKPTLQNWCKNNHKVITIHSYGISKWLKTNYKFEEIKGKTFKDLGFDFKIKADFQQANLSLN